MGGDYCFARRVLGLPACYLDLKLQREATFPLQHLVSFVRGIYWILSICCMKEWMNQLRAECVKYLVFQREARDMTIPRLA